MQIVLVTTNTKQANKEAGDLVIPYLSHSLTHTHTHTHSHTMHSKAQDVLVHVHVCLFCENVCAHVYTQYIPVYRDALWLWLCCAVGHYVIIGVTSHSTSVQTSTAVSGTSPGNSINPSRSYSTTLVLHSFPQSTCFSTSDCSQYRAVITRSQH